MAEQCKEMVFRDYHSYRCSRKAVQDGYCRQHHPDVVKARADAAQAKWDAKWAKVSEKTRLADAALALLEKLDRLLGIVHEFTSISGYKVCDIGFLNDCAAEIRKAKGEQDG